MRTAFVIFLLMQIYISILSCQESRFISKTGEVVLRDSSGSKVHEVVFVLNKQFKEVYGQVKKWVLTEMGIEREKKRIAKVYMEPEEVYYFMDDSTKRKITEDEKDLRTRLENMGVRLDSLWEYEIKTNQYNIVHSIEGYSELRITMYDARQILNCDCSIMMMFRRDHWLDWAVLGKTGIPLPFKLQTFSDNITMTEVGYAREIYAFLGEQYKQYFVLKKSPKPLMDIELISRMKKVVNRSK